MLCKTFFWPCIYSFNLYITLWLHPLPQSEAHKRLTLAHLPPVLVLHLKRFLFDKTGGSQKLAKQVSYSTEMEINKGVYVCACVCVCVCVCLFACVCVGIRMSVLHWLSVLYWLQDKLSPLFYYLLWLCVGGCCNYTNNFIVRKHSGISWCHIYILTLANR